MTKEKFSRLEKRLKKLLRQLYSTTDEVIKETLLEEIGFTTKLIEELEKVVKK